MIDDISAHHRMRKSLLGIRDLDPEGIDARVLEMDDEIARLEARLAGRKPAVPDCAPAERAAVKAA